MLGELCTSYFIYSAGYFCGNVVVMVLKRRYYTSAVLSGRTVVFAVVKL